MVYGALVSLLQLLHFRCRALGEELIERTEREVVDSEVDDTRSGHVLAPHGCAKFISRLVAGANDVVVRPDKCGGFVDGVALNDNIAGAVTGARQAADPYLFGQ